MASPGHTQAASSLLSRRSHLLSSHVLPLPAGLLSHPSTLNGGAGRRGDVSSRPAGQTVATCPPGSLSHRPRDHVGFLPPPKTVCVRGSLMLQSQRRAQHRDGGMGHGFRGRSQRSAEPAGDLPGAPGPAPSLLFTQHASSQKQVSPVAPSDAIVHCYP